MSSADMTNLLAPDLEFWSVEGEFVLALFRATQGVIPAMGEVVDFYENGDPNQHRTLPVTGRQFYYTPEGNLYKVRIEVSA